MQLSLCMIVKDEASRLPNCLASVQQVVDEMVVVDTGSTDQTAEIARNWGAQVYTFPWTGDFAAARNYSLQQARGEWILVLDADETLLPEVVPTLQQICQQPHYLLINLLRQEVGAQQSPYSLVSRLFRRSPDIYFARPFHELVDDSVVAKQAREPHWQIAHLPQVAIVHTGYQARAIAQQQKVQRSLAAMTQYWSQHPQDAYICSKLGALYVQQGELEQGLKLLTQGLQATAEPGAVLYELHYHLGIAHEQQGHPAQAAQHYQAALTQPIADVLKLGAFNNWGNLLQAQGQLTEAQAMYQQMLAIDPGLAVAHYNLGLTWKAQGNLPAAITAYQQALQHHPDYAEAYQNLGVVLLKTGQVAASLAAFRRAIALHEHDQPEEAMRLRETLASMGFSP